MPKKKIPNLSGYSTLSITSPTQENSKYSAFFEQEDTEKASTDTTELSPQNEAQNNNQPDSTSKTKSINMAFTEANYAIIMSTTAKLGINCAYLINYLISNVNTDELKTYADSQPLRKGNHAPRRKGSPMKRINIKFTHDNYQKLRDNSVQNDTTITTTVNMIIELYAKNSTSI